MVGCTLVVDGETVGEVWRRRLAAGRMLKSKPLTHAPRSRRTATLEPSGKTGPWPKALIAAGMAPAAVVAQQDPFSQVSAQGIASRTSAVDVGLLESKAQQINAPYRKLINKHPWIIAKWAMTLDGKIATRTLDSRWVSSDA